MRILRADRILELLDSIQFRTFSFSGLLPKNVKFKTRKIVVLPVVLYGSETWPLVLRGQSRMGISENWVLRSIIGLKRDETIDG
jgi:hypothetical protein